MVLGRLPRRVTQHPVGHPCGYRSAASSPSLSSSRALWVAFASAGLAQAPGERSPHRLAQTRAELEGRLRQLEEMTRTGTYAGVSPDFVRQETAYVQRRLSEGDFHAGDRVLIVVEDPMAAAGDPSPRPPQKSTEQQLSDTFTVNSMQELTLPVLGSVSLRGVLRTELDFVLIGEIGRYIRDPVVQARSLVGLALSGKLVRPGYHSVPTDAVLPAVLMAAGERRTSPNSISSRSSGTGERFGRASRCDARSLREPRSTTSSCSRATPSSCPNRARSRACTHPPSFWRSCSAFQLRCTR